MTVTQVTGAQALKRGQIASIAKLQCHSGVQPFQFGHIWRHAGHVNHNQYGDTEDDVESV